MSTHPQTPLPMNTPSNLTVDIQDLTCLYEITKELASATDLRDCLDKAMQTLADLKSMTNGTVSIINPLTGKLEIEVAHGLTAENRKRGQYQIGEGITGRVVASGEPIIVPHIGDEPLFLNKTRARGDQTKQRCSFICVPIQSGKQVIGALSIDRVYEHGLDQAEADLRFLTILSSLIAQTALRIQTVNQETEELRRENQKLRRELSGKNRITDIIGNSSRMQEVFEMAHRVVDSTATVLLRGESGTGKTLVAKALHYNSRRRDKSFMVVNCSALPETLLESELFGHEKGAFTGATEQKIGRFEQADGGTLFLDEIGDMSLPTQTKILRVLQDGTFERVGGGETVRVDVRMIAATNKDLEAEVSTKGFREDLFYRLNVVRVRMPAVREREGDIRLLVNYFLKIFAERLGKSVGSVQREALAALETYQWPGNVRELENVIERAFVVCKGEALLIGDLPVEITGGKPTGSAGSGESAAVTAVGAEVGIEALAARLFRLAREDADLKVIPAVERELIVCALKETAGNQVQAARLLGITRATLRKRVEKFGIRQQQDFS